MGPGTSPYMLQMSEQFMTAKKNSRYMVESYYLKRFFVTERFHVSHNIKEVRRVPHFLMFVHIVNPISFLSQNNK